jgi:hypothetical protein
VQGGSAPYGPGGEIAISVRQIASQSNGFQPWRLAAGTRAGPAMFRDRWVSTCESRREPGSGAAQAGAS